MTMDAIARMRVCLAMTRLLNTAAKAIHEPAEAPMKMRSRSAGSSLVRGAMKSTLSDQSLASIHVMASVQRTSVFKVSLFIVAFRMVPLPYSYRIFYGMPDGQFLFRGIIYRMPQAGLMGLFRCGGLRVHDDDSFASNTSSIGFVVCRMGLFSGEARLVCCSWRFAVLVSCLAILSFRHAFLCVPQQCWLPSPAKSAGLLKLRLSVETSCERRFVDAWFIIAELRLKSARSHEGCRTFTHRMRDGVYGFLPSGVY